MPADAINHFRLEKSTDGINWTVVSDAIGPNETSADPTDSPPIYYRVTEITNAGIQDVSNTVSKTPVSGKVDWKRVTSGPSGVSLAIDRVTKDIVACGAFSGTVDFGSPVGSITSNGAQDGWFARYTKNNVLLYVKQIGGAATDGCNGVVFDSLGNVIVTGNIGNQPVVFDATHTLTGSGIGDMFVAKYDNASPPNLLWVKQFASSGYDYGVGVAVDSLDNIIATGFLSAASSSSIGGHTVSPPFLVMKLSKADGSVLWVNQNSNGGYGWTSTAPFYPCEILGLAVDAQDNVWTCGGYAGTANFGIADRSALTYSTIFFVKCSGADGHTLWDKEFAGTGVANKAYGVCINPIPPYNAIFVGGFQGEINFGGGQTHTVYGGGFFYAAFDTNGNHLWDVNNGGPGNSASGVAIDNVGRIVISGTTNAGISGGDPSLLYGQSFFILGMQLFDWNTAPLYQWGHHTGSTPIPVPTEVVAFNGLGNVVVGGTINGSFDFGDGAVGAVGNFIVAYWK